MMAGLNSAISQRVGDLRSFLEEDPWGRDWVSKFFRADFADEPLPEIDFKNVEDQEQGTYDSGMEGTDQ